MTGEEEDRWELIDNGETGIKLRYGVLDHAEVLGTFWTRHKGTAVRMVRQRNVKHPWGELGLHLEEAP